MKLSGITNKITNFLTSGQKLYAIDGTPEEAYIDLLELVQYLQIYIPATEPAIVTGTPNTLTLSCNDQQSAKFEPRLSVGTYSINVDFTLAVSNVTGTEIINLTPQLSGTRIITLAADWLVSISSELGTWVAPALTITAGTDDLIEMSATWNKTNSKWMLKVSEVAV